MHEVVNHDDILKWPILDDPEVFDEKTVLGFHTILAMKKSKDGFFGSVQVVNDGFGIIESACCEHVDIVVLAHVG